MNSSTYTLLWCRSEESYNSAVEGVEHLKVRPLVNAGENGHQSREKAAYHDEVLDEDLLPGRAQGDDSRSVALLGYLASLGFLL